MSDEEIEQLLTKGKTDLLEGFVSKAGKNFNAYLKLDNGNVVFEFPSNKSSFKCPNCGEYLTTYQWGYGCPNRDFRIGKVAGVTLSENQIKNLLEKKNTGLIEGFISKAGKPFSAELHLNDNNEVIFHFPDNKGDNGGGNSQETDMKCPVCGNSLRKFNFGFACPKRDFIVGRVASRMIEEKELRELLKNGRVGPLDGFTSKSGNKFSASLILTDKGQITFSYD